MRREMINSFKVLAIVCATLILIAGCAKKQVEVCPPTDVSVTEETGPMITEEATDTEAVRQARLEEIETGKRAEDIGLDNIYFEFDRSDLSAEARETLKKIGDRLRSNPSYSLDIAGHCDERGTIEYNLALGERRALSAKKFLVALGISGDRISTISYGEERPVDPSSNEEAWAKNRRDEFKVIE